MEGAYKVELFWDSDAQVWVATSEEVLGLVLEAATIDEIVDRTLNVVPELIELNNLEKKENIYFNYNRHERVAFA